MRYTVKKLTAFLFTMVVVSLLTFIAFDLISGDPAQAMLGTEATPEKLAALRERMKNNVAMRQDNSTATRVVVGMATCGIAAGARPVLTAFVEEVNRRGLKDVVVTQAGCIGMCKLEPIVEVFQPGKEKVTYVKMTPEKVSRIVTEHLVNGSPVTEYTVGAYME